MRELVMLLSVKHDDSHPGGSVQLSISGDMTIYAIADLKEAITPEITGQAIVDLNLSEVEEIDSAGIQLIMALRNHLIKANKTIQLTGTNGTVSKLLEVYGLSNEHFGKPS